MGKLVWSRLKNFKCPKCNEYLHDIGTRDVYECTGCEFSISKEKFDNIINTRKRPKEMTEEENLGALNNL